MINDYLGNTCSECEGVHHGCPYCLEMGIAIPLWEAINSIVREVVRLDKIGGEPDLMVADDPVSTAIGWSIFDSEADERIAEEHTTCFQIHLNHVKRSPIRSRLDFSPLKTSQNRAHLGKLMVATASNEFTYDGPEWPHWRSALEALADEVRGRL